MAHHGMEGFEDEFNPDFYSTPISDPSSNEHHVPFASPYVGPEDYAFQFARPEMLTTSMYNPLQSTGTSAYEPGFDDRLLTATMAGHAASRPMALDANHAFAPAYEPWQMQPGLAPRDLAWAPPNWEDVSYPMPQGLTPGPAVFPQYAASREATRSGPSRPPVRRAAGAATSHRLIRPKRSSPVKGSLPSRAKPTASEEATPYANIYSHTGFDIMGVLAEVVSRPDPKVDIGAVDLSCAFVLCDILAEDHPIVYVSEAFERLTGYTEAEIVGQNCRFLQSPGGVVRRGMERKFVDPHTAFQLRTTIDERTEIQVSIINYRKGGQPFMNLVTMIPICLHSDDYRFYVGFQVDLVEKPDAVTRRNPNGSYMINYQRNQLPPYVVPPAVLYQAHPDLMTQFGPEQVSTILRSLDTHGPDYRGYLDRILVENADDVIHVMSFESELLYLSPSCRRCLAYEPVELVGKTLSMLCHPSDIGPVSRELWAQTTTDPICVAYRIRKKDSGYVWFESRGAWHIGQGRRQFMVLVGRVRPVYHLEQVVKLGGGALAETDIWIKLSASGIILFASSKVRPVLGRVPDDLVGKSLLDLVDAPQETRQALDTCYRGQEARLGHRIRHQKGHLLAARTTLFPGDVPAGGRPSFLVAQIHFPTTAAGDPSTSTTTQGDAPLEVSRHDPQQYPSDNQSMFTTWGQPPQPLFRELHPTRGSHWQFELRALAQHNQTLSEEVHRLLARRKKRKRRQSTVPVEKSCVTCRTRRTPEWRRGPSGNRDLCNSCGLRWAKQVRIGQASERVS